EVERAGDLLPRFGPPLQPPGVPCRQQPGTRSVVRITRRRTMSRHRTYPHRHSIPFLLLALIGAVSSTAVAAPSSTAGPPPVVDARLSRKMTLAFKATA